MVWQSMKQSSLVIAPLWDRLQPLTTWSLYSHRHTSRTAAIIDESRRTDRTRIARRGIEVDTFDCQLLQCRPRANRSTCPTISAAWIGRLLRRAPCMRSPTPGRACTATAHRFGQRTVGLPVKLPKTTKSFSVCCARINRPSVSSDASSTCPSVAAVSSASSLQSWIGLSGELNACTQAYKTQGPMNCCCISCCCIHAACMHRDVPSTQLHLISH